MQHQQEGGQVEDRQEGQQMETHGVPTESVAEPVASSVVGPSPVIVLATSITTQDVDDVIHATTHPEQKSTCCSKFRR
jgi:hypothetical protein